MNELALAFDRIFRFVLWLGAVCLLIWILVALIPALSTRDDLPSIEASAPNHQILDDQRIQAASASVVRIIGNACGIAYSGSGWVAAPDTIVTNSHVVAGESETFIEISGRPPQLRAKALVFNPVADLAVLYVPGLNLPVLRIAAKPEPGEVGAVLGYPEDGPFNAQPARIGASQLSSVEDIYDRTVGRKVTSIAALLRPGNSGGPLVGDRGNVLTTVYSRSIYPRNSKGGYGVANAELIPSLTLAQERKQRGRAASTEHCMSW